MGIGASRRRRRVWQSAFRSPHITFDDGHLPNHDHVALQRHWPRSSSAGRRRRLGGAPAASSPRRSTRVDQGMLEGARRGRRQPRGGDYRLAAAIRQCLPVAVTLWPRSSGLGRARTRGMRAGETVERLAAAGLKSAFTQPPSRICCRLLASGSGRGDDRGQQAGSGQPGQLIVAIAYPYGDAISVLREAARQRVVRTPPARAPGRHRADAGIVPAQHQRIAPGSNRLRGAGEPPAVPRCACGVRNTLIGLAVRVGDRHRSGSRRPLQPAFPRSSPRTWPDRRRRQTHRDGERESRFRTRPPRGA